MKIEEIEKLNRERTQGKWESKNRFIKTTDDITGYDTIFKKQNFILVKERSGVDAAFIASTPVITDQYIRARRFQVTDEFFGEVYSKTPYERKFIKDNSGMVELLSEDTYCPKQLIQTAIQLMWNIIENDQQTKKDEIIFHDRDSDLDALVKEAIDCYEST